MGNGKPRKIVPHDMKTKQYREIIITALEEVCKDIREGNIDCFVMNICDVNGDYESINFQDSAKQSYLKLLGLHEIGKHALLEEF